MIMNVGQPIKNDRNLLHAVIQANSLLEKMVGVPGESLTADWDLTQDSMGRPLVSLALSDATGSEARANFTPSDLNNESYLTARLYKVWGDLLQYRSHKQLSQLAGNNVR